MNLPDYYQAAVSDEQRRLTESYLKPRGIDRRHVLIIGGAGYVGSVLTDHFLAQGYRVRSFDNLLFNHGLTVVPFLKNPNYQFVNGDLTKESDFTAALDGITDVIMLAGLVGDPVTKKYPDQAALVNDDGHALMLRLLGGRGLNKVVFVSTCSNYGLIEGDQLADENFELNPLSLYAKSKVRIEHQLLSQKGTVDYAPTILRFATAFGLSARMRFDLTVSEFTRTLFLGKSLLVYDADTWRPYCHLRDFALLIERVFDAPRDDVAFDVFNAGSEDNNFTKQMIVEAILDIIPQGNVRYQERGADPRNYRVDFTKVRERLYFEPRFSVRDGIVELVEAMKQGLFINIDSPKSFYGNLEINFPGFDM